MRYDLPVSVEVNGTEYKIRSDYRDILTIIEAISDKDFTEADKAEAMLDIFTQTLITCRRETMRKLSRNAFGL